MLEWTSAIILECLIYVGALYIGWNLAGRPLQVDNIPAHDPFVLMLLGWYFQSLAIFALGCLGQLSPYALSLAIFIPIGLVILDRRPFSKRLAQWADENAWVFKGNLGLWILVIASAFWLGILVAIPPFYYDVLFYHYGQPLAWLVQGRIYPLSGDFHSYLPMPERMHALWGLGLIGETMPAVMHYFHVLWLAVLTSRIIHKYLTPAPPWPLLGSLTVLLTPILWEELGMKLVETTLAWAGACFLLLYPAVLHKEVPHRKNFLVFSAVTGILMTVKFGVTVGYLLAFLITVILAYRRPLPPVQRWLPVLGLILVFIILAPWFLFAWIGGGHPLVAMKPYLGNLELYSTRWQNLFIQEYPWDQPQLYLSSVFAAIQRFYFPEPFLPATHFGIFLLALFPASLALEHKASFITLWLLGFTGVISTASLPRFSLHLLALEVFIVLSALYRITPSRYVVIFLIIGGMVGVYGMFHHPTTAIPVRYAIQQLFRIPRTHMFPSSVPICLWVNENLNAKKTNILFVGETRYYPCYVPFTFWNPFFRHPMEILKHDEPPEVTWDKIVRQGGYTHILYTPKEARRLMELPESLFRRMEQWMFRRGKVLIMGKDSTKKTFLLALEPDPTSLITKPPSSQKVMDPKP